MEIGSYVIVRSSPSGCWAGTLEKINGNTVTLKSARRLWRWWSAKGVSLSGVAAHGLHPDKTDTMRIAAPVDVVVFEVCEILAVTEAAKKTILDQPEIAQ
jgi:hypothetical protein